MRSPSGTVVQGWINLDGGGANDLHFAYYAKSVSKNQNREVVLLKQGRG